MTTLETTPSALLRVPGTKTLYTGCSVSLEDLVLMTWGLDAAKIPDPDGMGQPDYIAGLLGETPLESPVAEPWPQDVS